MKQNKYNDFLNKISCSEDFRAKMEDMLSAAPAEQHEFADVVDTVERAPKTRIKQIIVTVAACAAVCVVGGAVYQSIKNNPFNSSVSEYTNLPFADFTQSDVEASVQTPGTFTEQHIPSLSNSTKTALAEFFNSSEWVSTETFYSDSETSGKITLTYTADNKNCIVNIDALGRITFSWTDFDGNSGEVLYQSSHSTFYDTLEAILFNILSSDFSQLDIDVRTPDMKEPDVSAEQIKSLSDYCMSLDYSEYPEPEYSEVAGEGLVLYIGTLCEVEIFPSDVISIQYYQSDDNIRSCSLYAENIYNNAYNSLFGTEPEERQFPYCDFTDKEIVIDLVDSYPVSDSFDAAQLEAFDFLVKNTFWKDAEYNDISANVNPKQYITLDISDVGKVTFYDNGYVKHNYSVNNNSLNECYFAGEEFFEELRIIVNNSFTAETLINKLSAENDKYYITYMADSGQFSQGVYFTLDDIQEFKQLLLDCDWEVFNPDITSSADTSYSFYNKFYICGPFMLCEDGYLYERNSSNIAYRVSDSDKNKIVEYLHAARDKDKLASLVYKLIHAEEKYSTMSAGIRADYTVERFEAAGDSESYAKYILFTEGTIQRDNVNNIHYIDVDGETQNGESISAECMYMNDQTIYVEHGRDIDKLDNVRGFFKNSDGIQTSYESFEDVLFTGTSAELDYLLLDNKLIHIVTGLQNSYFDGSLQGQLSDYFTYTSSGSYEEYHFNLPSVDSPYFEAMEVSCKIDNNGSIISITKSADDTVKYSFELSDVVYDSPDFTMHEFTPEEVAYFNFSCEDFAENSENVFLIDYGNGSISKVLCFIDNPEHISAVKSELNRILASAEPIIISSDEIQYQYSYSRFIFRDASAFDEFFVYFPIYPDNPDMEPEKPFNFKYKDSYYLLNESELKTLNEIRDSYYFSDVTLSTGLNQLDFIDHVE